MEPLDSIYRWSERLRDPARAGSFGRFVLRRFLDFVATRYSLPSGSGPQAAQQSGKEPS